MSEEIPPEQVARLVADPWFQQWLHGAPDSMPDPIVVPLFGSDEFGPVISQMRIDIQRHHAPAPWALREYRYLCYVAVTASGQEIARSEWWPWYRHDPVVADILGPPIPGPDWNG